MKSNRQPTMCGKSLFGTSLPVRRVLNLAVLSILFPVTVYANPDGAQVVQGQAAIDTSVQGVTAITSSPNAIIQWQNFTIAENETTRFIQENSQSAVLNRIIGENPSQILGQLLSNGKVLLINPNGIVFGADSVVDTQGLIVSSLNLSDDDFLKGNYHFLAGSGAGAIVNEGIIRAGKDGNIVLIAPSITNNGIIKSEGGQITLAAGQELILTSLDNPEIRFAVQAPNNAVLNLGKLLTEGGAVNVFADTIQAHGEINADSVEMDAQGHIKLVAKHDIDFSETSKLSADNSQGNAGTIHIESQAGTVKLQGRVTADGAETGQGGQIAVLGEQVALLGKATLSANGGRGGGEVLVGGDFQGNNPAVHNAKTTFVGAGTTISADAKTEGNGGKVIVWADKSTRAYGQISAQGGSQGGAGGFVETSGKALDVSGIHVDASAPKGRGGQWLLDPNNITIQATGTDAHVKGNPDWTTENDEGIVTTGSIQAALNNGTSVTLTTGSAGANTQEGNITVAANIIKSAGNDASLTLQAHHNIDINGRILATVGQLDLTLTPNVDATGGGITTIANVLDLNHGILTLNGESHVLLAGSIRNATLEIPEWAVSQIDGSLSNINEVTIRHAGKLTLNHANSLPDTVFNNSGILDINAFLVMDTLNLLGGTLGGAGNVTINQAFNVHPGAILTGGGVLSSAEGATTNLLGTGTVQLDKQWNNAGTINWDGDVSISHTSANTPFYNNATGIININKPGVRELNAAVFNHRGTINLSAGTLKIYSPGTDTGRYKVLDTGWLQFLTQGSRIFTGGAEVDSANTVTFSNGSHYFGLNTHYQAAQTELNLFATLSFNTNHAVSLANLSIDSATLAGNDTVTITDSLTLQAATLSGAGKLITAPASSTTLAGGAALYLNKRWDNFGTVNWEQADLADNGKVSIFNNGLGGIINIGTASTAADKEFAINTAAFNNNGLVNLAGGMLKVFSPGKDTGSYQARGNGQLQYGYGSRIFDHAVINSPNTVTFSNGKNYFRNGAAYSAGATDIISGAVLNFSNHAPISLAKLTLDGGTLEGSDAVTITESLHFHSGVVTGGTLTTAAGATTVVADKDTVYLGKNWDNFGVVHWNGVAAIRNPSNTHPTFNNAAGGFFTVNASHPEATLDFNLFRFNNAGTLNVSNGLLKIYSQGNDTGRYQVTDAGELQFWLGTRTFKAGAVLDSANKMTFAGGGKFTFASGSSYSAPETEIDAAKWVLDTGNSLHLPILTIANGATLESKDAMTVDKALNFSYGLLTGDGKLTTSQAATTHLNDGAALLNKDWDNFGNVLFEAQAGTLHDLPRNPFLPARHWDNYGTINWQGAIVPRNDLGNNIILTNKAGGFFNVNSNDPAGVRQLNLGGFNNDGTVNLSGGILAILSDGTDTGQYRVTDSGQLQFIEGARLFKGSGITSAHTVLFENGTAVFTDNAVLEAPMVRVSGAALTILSALALNNVTLSDSGAGHAGAAINNGGGLTTKGQFVWADGSLSGGGAYHFTNGFAYTRGSMRATGSVNIVDNSGTLTLPAMPTIGNLQAYSSGELVLAGDIFANSPGTSIVLETTTLNNDADATLMAANGRWLVFSHAPLDNTLGVSGADFKHYGCNAASCQDGFTVAATNGNGLLYSIVPLLTVTPDNLTRVYGDAATVPVTYAGFIDGDTPDTAGIGGTANYRVSGAKSGSGHYHVGVHDVSYLGGLSNGLGYQFQDNTESRQEWAITPRELGIAADAAAKIYGEADPQLHYQTTGFLAGDTLTGNLAREEGENVGDHLITQGSLAASEDYHLSYTANNLGISPRALSVIADAQNKWLGELDPAFTYRSLGLVKGDTLSGFLARLAGETGGHYPITQGSLTASNNYRLTYTPAELTIKPQPVIPPTEAVQAQENQQQNEVLVLTQQATLNDRLDNVTSNNMPSDNTSSTDDKKRASLKQCQ